jgi:hypothetical protein
MRHRTALAALFLLLALAAPPLSSGHRQGFSLSVVIDGCEAPEYEHAGRLYVEALRGPSFSLRVSNPTSERIAAALSVDGRNVIDAGRTTARKATKWVLGPGQTIDIPGWQVSGETARKFFFTETARSYAKWLGDTENVGTIEAVFFREKRRWPMPIDRPGAIEEGESRGGRADDRPLRGAAPPMNASPEAPGGSGSRARKQEADQLAATGIGERTDFSVHWIDFDEESAPAARIALRYEFRRDLVRLGVLPRHDDALAARERAHGFEPRYAPDPDRPR